MAPRTDVDVHAPQHRRRDQPYPRGNRAATGLRLAGASWGEIAEVLDLASPAAAKAAVTADLATTGSDAEGRDQLRDTEGERLNRLLRGVWRKATDPDSPDHLASVRAALAVIDRRIRLYGLDAPAEVVVHSPTTSEIDAWVGALLAGHGTVVEGEVVEAD